jgi:hypothetical protein
MGGITTDDANANDGQHVRAVTTGFAQQQVFRRSPALARVLSFVERQ